MPTPVTNISGIGPHTAKILKEHGYASAEDIASTTASKLSEVPGFGLSRSKIVIAEAKKLFSSAKQILESDSKTTLPKKAKKKSKKDKKDKTKAKGKKIKSSKKVKKKLKKDKDSKDTKKKGSKSKKKKKK